MELRQPIDDDDLALYLCVEDEILFLLLFWADDFREEMSPQQKALALDRSKKVLACTGRKIAKTIIGPESKVVRYGLLHDQRGNSIDEALVFCPRESQLDLILNRIYARVAVTPFFASFIPKGGMTRGDKPVMRWSTGLMVYFRVEGISGTDANMVGIRATIVIGDEMAFGNEICHTSRIHTAMPDAIWWYSGVPNGWRGSPFYRLDQTEDGADWSRHKYSTYVNPIFSGPEQKQELIRSHGGENTHGYKTQVLGEWGDEFTTSFPPGSISIGNQPYFVKTLTSALKNSDTAIALALGLPAVRADKFCVGWDYGFSPDPAILKIAYLKDGIWLCYARIDMRQVPLPIQVRVVKYLYQHILQGILGGISTDNADAVQVLQADDPDRADRFFRAVPGGSMQMVDSEGKLVTETDPQSGKEVPVKIRIKQHLTERFREFMINHNLGLEGIQLVLGRDSEEHEELAGTTERRTESYVIYQGPPDPDNSRGQLDHITDANRYLTDAIMRVAVSEQADESEAALIRAMGWRGAPGAWKAPWSKGA